VFVSFGQDDHVPVTTLLAKMETFGVVNAYYFKDKQNYGFVHFAEAQAAEVAIQYFQTSDFDGVHLSVEHATKTKDARSQTPGSPQGPGSAPVVEKPDTILVLKNLPFHLKQDQLQDILLNISTTVPQSINLHFDNLGVFRGMAFVKYHRLDDAIFVYEALNGFDVSGRKVRVEYKRKPSAKPSDAPNDWQDDEELRKLWDQLREFKDNALLNDLTLSPGLSNAQRKHVHAMADKLKLVHYSIGEGDQRCLNLSKKSAPSPTTGYSKEGESKARAIEIKGRRRGDSDAKGGSPTSSGEPSSFGRSRYGSSGGSFGHKFPSSAPGDSNMESGSWRSSASPAHMQLAAIQPSRQPKGPDGSCGFGDVYKTQRKVALSPLGNSVSVVSGGVS